jgi:hypothetical protein
MARIKVTAGPGRVVPVPSSLGTAPGATMLFLKPGDELEVDESDAHVVRSLIDGDFVVVEPPAPPAGFTRTYAELAKADTSSKEG